MMIDRRDRLIVVALVSLTLTIATPVSVFRVNVHEFKFGLLEFLPTSLMLFIVGAGLLAVLERLGRPLIGDRRLFVVLSCLFYLLWLQANVLQWPYGPLEQGEWHQKWHYGVIDGAIWIAVLALGITFAGALSPVLSRLNRWAIVVVSLSIPFSVYGLPLHRTTYVLDQTSLFEFSADKNVIVILLDQTQSDVFLELASEDEFVDAFTGFTFFADYMSNAQNTSLSVPMSLTGRYYDNSEPYVDYVRDGMIHASLPRLLKDAGFRSDLFFTYNIFANEWLDPSFVSNLKTPKRYRLAPAAEVSELGLFVSVPHFTRRLIYDGEDWLFQHTTRDVVRNARRSMTRSQRVAVHTDSQPSGGDRDTRFVGRLLRNADLSSGQPTFKFYHWAGGHPPLRLDENGDPLPRHTWNAVGTYRQKVRYKMRLLVQVFEHLQALGVYDRSLIVVMSDHGNGLREDTRAIRDPYTGEVHFHEYESTRANALLMLKDFDADHPLRVLPHPLESLQIKDLIFRRVQGEMLGAILDEIPADRVRRFVNYFVNEFRPYAEHFRELLVVGPVWNPDSFVFLHTHPPGQSSVDCPAQRGGLRYRGDLAAADRVKAIADGSWEIAPPAEIESEDSWLALVQFMRPGGYPTTGPAQSSLPSSIWIEASGGRVSQTRHASSGLVELQGQGTEHVRLSFNSAGDPAGGVRIRGIHFFEVFEPGGRQ